MNKRTGISFIEKIKTVINEIHFIRHLKIVIVSFILSSYVFKASGDYFWSLLITFFLISAFSYWLGYENCKKIIQSKRDKILEKYGLTKELIYPHYGKSGHRSFKAFMNNQPEEIINEDFYKIDEDLVAETLANCYLKEIKERPYKDAKRIKTNDV